MAAAVKLKQRKLISLTGWRGFAELLQPGEVLILELIDLNGSPREILISSLAAHNRIVNSLDGEKIVGFWARSHEERDS